MQQESRFGSPRRWPYEDMIGASRRFDVGLTLEAYRNGVFPMPIGNGATGWFSPVWRGILPLDGLRVTRSLAKMTRRYEVRIDTAFETVVERCADPDRPGGWIDDSIRGVYHRLWAAGIAHSVEAWTLDGQLAGGLYGIALGGLFAGESMFHDAKIGRDASKVALIRLVELLRAPGEDDRLLDVQWRTPHLASLGVIEVPREAYLLRLQSALALPDLDWASDLEPRT